MILEFTYAGFSLQQHHPCMPQFSISSFFFPLSLSLSLSLSLTQCFTEDGITDRGTHLCPLNFNLCNM